LNSQVVPDAIGGLEQLEELRLASNNLVSLPDSIGLISNLKLLDVSGNRLRVLPDSISKCRYILGPSHFFLLNSEQESSL